MSEEFRSYVNTIRREFADKPLSVELAGDNPYTLFERWFDEAVGVEALDPYAMSIATVDKQGRPSVRVVYMRDISENGLVFYTNYLSNKSKDLLDNNAISANFFWVELDRQVRFRGKAIKVDESLSDEYFSKRPRASKIGAWASKQSGKIRSREELLEDYKKAELNFKDIEVTRPPYWGGFLIEVDEIEFWQGRPMRLHDRIIFSKNTEGEWVKKRLAP